MQRITAWLMALAKSKNWTAHSIAAFGILLATIITENQSVRNEILGLFATHPKIGTWIVILAGIILKYTHSSSDAGKIAVAKVILAKPDAPTKSEVDAADVTLTRL